MKALSCVFRAAINDLNRIHRPSLGKNVIQLYKCRVVSRSAVNRSLICFRNTTEVHAEWAQSLVLVSLHCGADDDPRRGRETAARPSRYFCCYSQNSLRGVGSRLWLIGALLLFEASTFVLMVGNFSNNVIAEADAFRFFRSSVRTIRCWLIGVAFYFS